MSRVIAETRHWGPRRDRGRDLRWDLGRVVGSRGRGNALSW